MENVKVNTNFSVASTEETKTFEERGTALSNVFKLGKKLTVVSDKLHKQTVKGTNQTFDRFGFPCIVEGTTVQVLAKPAVGNDVKVGQGYSIIEDEFINDKQELIKFYRLNNN